VFQAIFIKAATHHCCMMPVNEMDRER
jgi:hypothetical protein